MRRWVRNCVTSEICVESPLNDLLQPRNIFPLYPCTKFLDWFTLFQKIQLVSLRLNCSSLMRVYWLSTPNQYQILLTWLCTLLSAKWYCGVRIILDREERIR